MKIRCDVCPHHCLIEEKELGLCGARINTGSKIIGANYGMVTALALDPIEKKPLARFMPGKRILSVGSYGCNLYCPFCQNYTISQKRADLANSHMHSPSVSPNIATEHLYPRGLRAEYISPERIAHLAEKLKSENNIGLAFTYNEPLVGYEYVIDSAKAIRSLGMKNVLVTNGNVEDHVATQVIPLIDAVNVDLKSFNPKTYQNILGGDLDMVKNFIERAQNQKGCHVEVTVLIVPGLNDSETEMRKLSAWLASLTNGEDIPLHISRYFPAYKKADPPTSVDLIRNLTFIASHKLKYVYMGNC